MGLFKNARRYRKLLEDFGIEDGHVGEVIKTYENVLFELTGGKLSKPTYTKQVVLDAVMAHFCDRCDLTKSFTPKVTVDDEGRKKIQCSVCGKGLRRNDKHCPYCGSKVGAVDET